MSLRVVFLGTSGSIPTPIRALPAIAIQRKDELIMFDCGEGSQRQMVKACIGFHRKTKILITHLHGDHILGIPGLLQTMSLLDRRKNLYIYGPVGTEDYVNAIQHTVPFALTFPVKITEIERSGVVCQEKEYKIQALQTSHPIQNFAYALIEEIRPGRFRPEVAKALGVPEGFLWSHLQKGEKVKLADGKIVEPEAIVGPPRLGRKIVYSGDTSPTASFTALAKKADLLIHDATFDDELVEKARQDGHSTPGQAAETAKKAKVKMLVLTHISARYDDDTILLEQARKIFPSVEVAEDFMKIEIPLPDN